MYPSVDLENFFIILSWIVYMWKYHKIYIDIVEKEQIYGTKAVGFAINYFGLRTDSEVHVTVTALQ